MSSNIYSLFGLFLMSQLFPPGVSDFVHQLLNNSGMTTEYKSHGLIRSKLQANDLVPVMRFLGENNNLRIRLLFCEGYEDDALFLSKWNSDHLNDVTLQKYDGTKVSLSTILFPGKGVIILICICSYQDMLGMFKTIRKQSLSSHTITWILVLEGKTNEDELILGLETLVYEGTRVTLITKYSDQVNVVSSGRVNNEGIVRFHQIGRLIKRSTQPDFSSLRHLVIDYSGRQADISGRKLKMAALDVYPMTQFGEIYPNGSVEAKDGIDFNVVRGLSAALNFTFSVIPSVDGFVGIPKPDGTVTGMAGMVARREVNFSMRLAVNGARESVLDFTLPFQSLFLKIVSPAPKEKNRALAVLSPFTLWVWITIIACSLCIGPSVFLLSKSLKFCRVAERQHSFQSYSFNMFRSLVTQGNFLSDRYWPTRFVLFTWFLFCLLVSAMYSGMLIAVLAIPAYETPVDYLRDLPKAVQNGFTLGVRKETSHAYVFKAAEEGIFKKTWALFNHEEPSNSFVESFKLGMKKVLDGNFIFITSNVLAEMIARKLGKNKFHISRESFAPFDVAIPCQTGSPFLGTFSLTLLRMNEGGLIEKWVKDEYWKTELIANKFVKENSLRGYPAITLIHLQAAFFILTIGLLIAATVVFLENILGCSLSLPVHRDLKK